MSPKSAGMKKVKKKIKGIQSIDIGLSILSVFLTSPRPMPLKKLSEETGLSASKIHSYLVSFIKLKLVEQNAETGFYSLGPFAMRLGFGYLDQVDLLSVSKPIMLRLANETGLTVFLGVWGNRGPTIVNRVDGFNDTTFELRIGSVLPILTSALGRNYAAHLNDTMTQKMIIEEFKSLPKNLKREEIPSTMAELNVQLEEIRKQGISRARGLLLSDYTALSVPIFDFSGAICAGLTLMGKTDHMDDRPDGKPAQLLKAGGNEISTIRGYILPSGKQKTKS